MNDTRWRRAGRLLRWLLGAFSLVGGLTWILLDPGNLRAMLVGAVFAAAGLVLLMPHRITLPRKATAVAMVVAALAGTGAGVNVADRQVCCMYAYVENRGWPIDFMHRAAIADDPLTAERAAGTLDWTIDLPSLIGSLVLWAYVGMLLVVLAVVIRRWLDNPIRS